MVCRLAMLTKIKSISMSLKTSLIIGTNESGTAVNDRSESGAILWSTVG